MNKAGAIVSVKWLADAISSTSKNVRVLDGSWHLPSTHRNARAEYAREHIPGAMFFDIDGCARKETDLPHMLPKPAEFETYVGRLGINNSTHVVVYDNNERFPLFSAQRVWWTFRVFGHSNVSVLEGGLQKWRKGNNAVTDALVQVPAEKFIAKVDPKLIKSFEDIDAWFRDKQSFALIDARPAGRFTGKAPEPREDIKSGCIPDSVNMPFLDLMDEETQTFKSKEELLKMFEQLPVDLSKPVTATCGSGITACMVALAAHVCGKEDVAVYDGSWMEWFQRAKPDQMKDVPEN